jgi:hypothetical protein
MRNKGTEVITEREVKIEKEVVKLAKESAEIEKQVIVHVTIKSSHTWWQLRIWPSTYLIPKEGIIKSKLLNVENIPFYPQWLHIFGKSHRFTLIFEGLPKDCEVFDLIEEIPQEGGFKALGIKRNLSDVYHVKIFD